MAKVESPLFSAVARGSFRKTVTFYPSRGRNIARAYTVPTNPNTAAQQATRELFKDVVNAWTNGDTVGGVDIDANYKAGFVNAGKAQQISGLNLFIRRTFALNAGGKNYDGTLTIIPNSA